MEPVLEFDLTDPRIVEAVDVISEIDARPNLLDLSPDPRPITGGKFVVQAKLWTRTLPPSALRSLCHLHNIPARIIPRAS